MDDDTFLQEVDINGSDYFPQLPADKEQAERLEREGFLQAFLKHVSDGPPVKFHRLTAKGKSRVPRYR